MPFCNVSKDVSLHYITNSPKGDATDLDYNRPTVLLIPALFTDVTWLREQFKDPRLSQQYNLVAFDQRNMGKTKAPLSPRRDAYVDAADLAVAHELLQLPPCHVFAVSTNACGAALRLAMLWPAKFVSLCLCSTPNQAGEDPDWVPQGYMEITEAWCFPSDLETLEQACMEFSWFMFNGQTSTELEDEMIAWWQMNLPPTKRTNYLTQALCGMHRHRLTDKKLAAIQQPTLFIKGDKSTQNPVSNVEAISDKMLDSRVFIVKGGPEFLTIVPEYASVVHRVYSQFLRGISNPPFQRPSKPDPKRVCKEGLERLATLMDDPSIARRDPKNILSFCLFTPEVIDQNTKMIEKYKKGEKKAFTALNKQGQPIRRFSDRNREEWVPAAFKSTGSNVRAGSTSS